MKKSPKSNNLSFSRLIRRGLIAIFLLSLLGGGPVYLSSCQPKVCPANNQMQFQKKRRKMSRMNHMKRRGGKGQKMRKQKHRRPRYRFFETRFKRKQFKYQTK